MAVVIDPQVPVGTELLKLGFKRINDINQALVSLFTEPTTQVLTIGTPPFSFFDATARGAGRLSVPQPLNPNEIARLADIQSKVVVAPDVTGNGANYSGATTLVPDITAYAADTLYIVALDPALTTNTGGNNTLTLGTGPTVLLQKANNAFLEPGDLIPGSVLLVVYDAPTFRIVNFIGGALVGDPTVPLGAATKQYVDATVKHAVRTLITNPVPLGASQVTILSTTVNIPNDNSTYQLQVDYGVNLRYASGGHGLRTAAWITDGTAQWALNGINVSTGLNAVLGGGGISPALYTFSTTPTVTITFKGYTDDSGVTAEGLFGVGGMPQSYVTTTLIRTVT